jgi:hypothetical protein
MSYRDPNPEELKSPLFNAIWNEIKKWDINVSSEYSGYCGATGNHVCAILDAVNRASMIPDNRCVPVTELDYLLGGK